MTLSFQTSNWQSLPYVADATDRGTLIGLIRTSRTSITSRLKRTNRRAVRILASRNRAVDNTDAGRQPICHHLPNFTQTAIRCSSSRNAITMEMTRNRYFLLGILLILLGAQFRMIDSFVLNESTTRALARVSKETPMASNDPIASLIMDVHPSPTKKIVPPRWFSLALIAVGSVVSLHALAIPRD